jgi:predicted nucleotide-binding protein
MQQRIFSALAALRQRARQNVILELGFFIGKLGRARVCVLAPRTVECPSDINGIATISTANDWKKELLRELQAAAMLS